MSMSKLPNNGKVKVKEEDIILYLLRSSDDPVDPQRRWKGLVQKVSPETAWTYEYYRVISLEEGFEGLTEIVYPSQVVSILSSD